MEPARSLKVFEPLCSISPLWCFTLLVCFSPLSAQTVLQLRVVHPADSATVLSSDSVAVFGSATPASALVRVNGRMARRFKNGAFVSMQPVKRGEQAVTVTAAFGSARVSRRVRLFVPSYMVANPPVRLQIDTSFYFPRQSMQLWEGEKVVFFIKGTPGQSAWLEIGKSRQRVLLQELRPGRHHRWQKAVFPNNKMIFIPDIRGIYAGAANLARTEIAAGDSLRYFLASAPAGTLQFVPPLHLRTAPAGTHATALVLAPQIISEFEPADDAPIYLPAGAALRITGQAGPLYRARLSGHTTVWVRQSVLQFAPALHLAGATADSVKATEIVQTPRHLRFNIPLVRRYAYRIRETENGRKLAVSLYGIREKFTIPPLEAPDDLLQAARWRRRGEEPLRLEIALKRSLWGYRAFYLGNTLSLEIRRPPEVPDKTALPLQNFSIYLDPGHAPETGAVGATGATEQELTALYIRELCRLLQAKGAIVHITRRGGSGLNLASRTLLPELANADMFLSLHFNALPEGLSPLRPRGASTLYYFPHSRSYARSVQRELIRTVRTRELGVEFRNLAVCRISWMPSVLVEPAFLTVPAEEMRILDPRFRRIVCAGIVEGIIRFLQRFRR